MASVVMNVVSLQNRIRMKIGTIPDDPQILIIVICFTYINNRSFAFIQNKLFFLLHIYEMLLYNF